MKPAARLDRWLPEFDVVEHHERLVQASPARVYKILRGMDLGRARTVRVLLLVRGLVRPGRRTFTLEDLTAHGFTMLDDVPGEEIVLGLAGRFWRPTGGIVRLTPEQFDVFDRPGHVRAVWNFRIGADGDGSLMTTETRIHATDASARRTFARYWRVVGPFSGFIRSRMLASIAAEAEQAQD